MHLSKIILSSIIALCSLTCCNDISYNNVTIHARYADGFYDKSIGSINISVEIGSDISFINLPDKEIWDSHPGIIKGIFVDEKETTKVKASQLKAYDGSFKDIYVLYNYIDYEENDEYCIDEKTFFDGEYLNYKNESLTIANRHITSVASNYSMSAELEKNRSLGYCVKTATFNVNDSLYSLDDFDRLDKSINFSLGYFSCNENQEISFKNDLTKCLCMLTVFYDAACKINQATLEIQNFIYYKNNTSSIDYDL